MTLKKKILCVFLVCLIIIVGSGAVYGFSILNQISGSQLDEKDLTINELLDSDTVNIALFGIDGRDDVDGNRSDTIMIATLNFKTGSVKVTSVMRDLMVKIPSGRKNNVTYEKINSAYDYGEAQLAVKTLNENFDLNIKDYVVVNFDCLVDTVDALGGIDVNIANESILEWTNQYIMDVNDKVKKSDPFLETTGVQSVTGVQALAFCRNRYSDSDYMRTKRQREVVEQIVKKSMNVDLFTGINLLGKVYPYVSTSLSLQEMTTYAKAFMSLENKTFLDFRVATDELSFGDTIDEVWYLVPNTLADNVVALHKFLYDIDTYTPTPALMTISDHIAGIAGTSKGVTKPDSTTPNSTDNSDYTDNYNTYSEPTPSTNESYNSSSSDSTPSTNQNTPPNPENSVIPTE
ncbi:MAG: LCP family protein [Eubacterium sp.]